MGFRIYCDNKGCRKEQEPLLNIETNEVECTECGKDIKSVSYFIKVQMKSLGQVKKDEKRSQAFATKCKFCSKTAPPVVKSDKIHCSLCDEHLDYLSAPFANVIKQNIK